MTGRACVVVLNWQGRNYIRDCLRAALAQTYEDARVIVVDNASTDGSREIVRDEFPEATLVPLPENLHFARGTNAGVETALRDPECAYVMTLNNDTRMEPDALAALVVGMRDPRVGVVAAKLLFMDTGRINSAGISPTFDGSGVDRGWMQADEGQFDAALDVFGASAGAAVYRREALDRVGLFDGDFLAYYEDLDLAWRLRLAGWEARFAPGARVRHKYSASTSPRAIWKTYQGERNRIWNLVQNYPWRYAAVAVPWNASRVASALGRHLLRKRSPHPDSPTLSAFTSAIIRARLDAYAGMPRALEKRRRRRASLWVDPRAVGRWLRTYGVRIRDMPFD